MSYMLNMHWIDIAENKTDLQMLQTFLQMLQTFFTNGTNIFNVQSDWAGNTMIKEARNIYCVCVFKKFVLYI